MGSLSYAPDDWYWSNDLIRGAECLNGQTCICVFVSLKAGDVGESVYEWPPKNTLGEAIDFAYRNQGDYRELLDVDWEAVEEWAKQEVVSGSYRPYNDYLLAWTVIWMGRPYTGTTYHHACYKAYKAAMEAQAKALAEATAEAEKAKPLSKADWIAGDCGPHIERFMQKSWTARGDDWFQFTHPSRARAIDLAYEHYVQEFEKCNS